MKKLFIIFAICLLSTWQLFASSQFVDSIFHMKQNVVDFTDTGISENVRGRSFVNPSPADLVVGSIFQDVDGTYKKVTSITEDSDGTVYINTIKPDIREVLEFMYIPEQTLEVSIPNLAEAIEAGSQNYADGTEARLSKNFSVAGKKKTLKKGEKASAELELGEIKGDISATVNFGAALPYIRISWKKKWFIYYPVFSSVKGYVKADYKHNFGIESYVKLTTKTNDGAFQTEDIPLYTLGGSGLGVGLYNVDSIEGSITIKDTMKFRNRTSLSAGCDLAGEGIICWPTGCWGSGSSQVYFENNLDLKAEAKLKIGFYLKAEVEWSGFTLVECGVGGGPFLGLEGEFTYNVRYNSLSGSDSLGAKISNTGWHYDPYPKVKATLSAGLYADGEICVFDNKWKKQFLDEEWKKTIFSVSN